MEVANVEGVFLLLIIGIGAAIICNITEMLLAVRSRSIENKVGALHTQKNHQHDTVFTSTLSLLKRFSIVVNPIYD